MIPTLEEMSLANRIEGAHSYQQAKGLRQILFQLCKVVPEYKPFYEEAEDLYKRLSVAMGVDTEPVFDLDEYKKGREYQDLITGRRV